MLARFIVFLACLCFCGGVGAAVEPLSSLSELVEGEEGAGEDGSAAVDGIDTSSKPVGEVGEIPVRARSSPKKFRSLRVLNALASSGEVGVTCTLRRSSPRERSGRDADWHTLHSSDSVRARTIVEHRYAQPLIRSNAMWSTYSCHLRMW